MIRKKNMNIKGLLVTMLLAALSKAPACAGVVKGMVRDSGTGDALVGATVMEGTGNNGVVTDFEGNYEISLPEGKCKLTVRYIGYKEVTKEINVTSGTLTQDFSLDADNAMISEVTVVGETRHNTESAALREQQYANVSMTGVSEQQIKRTQDKDAGEVIRRIPGVSIIDDRFVMVRGLPQRYNNVWLNGAAVPSSEADQRAFSFDIIPSSQIDNMKVVKTAAPEYPADFSGGFIIVNTKDVPARDSWSVSLGGTMNTSTHLKDCFQAKGSGTDFLGFDNGLRKLDNGISTGLNRELNGYSILGNGLNNDWTVSPHKPVADISLSASMAKRWQLKNRQTLGLTGSLNYTYAQRTLADMKNNMFGAYDVVNDRSNYLRHATDWQYNNNVRIGGMLGLVWLSADMSHRIELKQIFNQLGKNRYTYRKGFDAQSDYVEQAEYYYRSRTTYSIGLSGRDKITDDGKAEWNVGYAYANRDIPDRRRYSVYGEEDGSLEVENLNDINREFSALDENIFSGSAKYEHQLHFGEWSPSFKIGGYGEHRSRKYNTRFFTYAWPDGQLPENLRTLDVPTQLLTEENYGGNKLYMLEIVDWGNNYEAKSTAGSGFLSLHLPFLGGKVEAYGGVRFEHSNTKLTSHTRRQEYSPASTVYNYNDLFPSLNIAYHIDEKQQLRLAYGRTTNRPEFRELSSSVYYDFDLASDVQGNHSLRPAYIDNLDLGWEFYPHAGEIISLSLFYKHFRDPIEWTYTVAGGTDLVYSFLNAKGADNYGVELDIRKQLDFINMPSFSLSVNASWINSNVKFEPGSHEDNRPMQGQSPYLINAGLFYNSDTAGGKHMPAWKTGWSASLLYNIIGKRITGVGRSVGVGETEVRVPDSYEMPRHQVDMNVAKEFGRLELRLSAKDILAQKAKFKQFEKNTSKGDIEQVTRSFRPGCTISFTATYKI